MSWPYWIALAALAFFIGRSWLKSREQRAAFAAKQALLARQAAAARAAYEIRWAPEAVFARRLQMDAAFVENGTVDVDVTARCRAALRSPIHLYVDRGCGIRGSELDSCRPCAHGRRHSSIPRRRTPPLRGSGMVAKAVGV